MLSRCINVDHDTAPTPAYSETTKNRRYEDVGKEHAVAGLVVLMLMFEARTAEATFPGKNGRIAFVTPTGPRDFGEIYTINPDGSGKFRVTNTKNTDEEWLDYAPDGKKIAYEGWDRDYVSDIYTINVTGGKPFQLTHNKMGDWGPTYAPDGKKIAYAARADRKTDYEIYTINAGGGCRVQVTHNRTDDGGPSWGSRL